MVYCVGPRQIEIAAIQALACSRRLTLFLSGSLNRISECLCVFANPNVPRHEHDQRRWLAKQLRCTQVHRVERTNRLDWKPSPHPSENRVSDTYEVAATLKTAERTHCRSLFVGGQPCHCTRAKNRTRGL